MSAFSVANLSYDVRALCLQDYENACAAFLEGVKLESGNTEIKEGLRYPTFPFWLHSSQCTAIMFFSKGCQELCQLYYKEERNHIFTKNQPKSYFWKTVIISR
jgi:hypothetical protein